MFEISPANAGRYLRERDLIPPGIQPTIEPLGWGISNTVLKVRLAHDCFVIKQPLPTLRVSDEWHFDQRRVLVERDCMALMGRLLPPGSVPEVRFADDENYIFGMSCVPDGAMLWKEALLDGHVEPVAAQRAAALLAEWHNRAANDSQIKERFADPFNFMQGRVEPYHLTTAKVHPDLAPIIESEVQRMLASRLTLVHGDYSPKNIFVFPDHVLTLDFEVAHFGDPAFDSAFCLNHLLLKAMNFTERAAGYLNAARSFWCTYMQRLAPLLAPEIEVATVRELGCLLLARIDGKSKVEYITEEAIRDRVRHIARHILLKQETSLGSLFARVEQVVTASN